MLTHDKLQLSLLQTTNLVNPLKLTPAQFRNCLGITQETLRHWRKVLPIFQGRTGYAPVFTTGDLVAGAIVKVLKDTCGISIKKFGTHSVGLGKICNETSWTVLNNSTLVLRLHEGDSVIISAKQKPINDKLSISVPLAPIMEQLTQALLKDSDHTQHPLYFPPSEVVTRKRKAGSP